MKNFFLPFLFVLGLILSPNFAEAGVEKTTDALAAAMTQIEKSNIKSTPSLTNAMKEGEGLLKNYYKLSKSVVYDKTSQIFDELIKYNNGSSIDITKPSWLY
jgi:hypothetical protein